MTVALAHNPQGLSEAEAARRLAERGTLPRARTSRSYASIVRANVFTVFNLILAVAGGLTLAFGEWQDALFLGVLVGNAGIGTVQEVRAKRALDGLTALVAPHATVVRAGAGRLARVEELVQGDLVRIGAGDQVVADGTLEQSESLRIDESILTGESRPVERSTGDEVRSGSFAVEGFGAYTVTAVGDQSYAARLTGEARSFRHPRSPLERALNRLLLLLVAVMVPLGIALGYALWHRHASLHTALPTSVAAVVTLVPEGLVLLASLTYAVAALRMARRGALAQQLNAIESLASVDVVCLDKTGTLTEPALRVTDLVGPESLGYELGRYAASATVRNATLKAIAAAYPAEPAEVEEQVPFSSQRRFGAQRIGGVGYVLGAPEHFELNGLEAEAEHAASAGRRVLAFGDADRLEDAHPEARGLVLLAERLRPDARTTVDWFRSQGVELKVLSGDRLETVASIARDAGIDGPALDASTLPAKPDELRRVALEHAVLARISPQDKRRVVEALRDAGRYVAMVGDGVNDVPALKAAQLAIAQGTGTQMARSVADVVLVRGDFAAVPAMVAEGRKILRNVQRVAKLFVTKSAFAAFLILSIGLTPTAYPLLPRQLTLAASLTIGIPGFFLALAPSSGSYSARGFLRELARFAVPAGTAAGLGVLSSYLFALNVLDLELAAARTVAVTVLVLVGLYLILTLEGAEAGRVRATAISILVQRSSPPTPFSCSYRSHATSSRSQPPHRPCSFPRSPVQPSPPPGSPRSTTASSPSSGAEASMNLNERSIPMAHDVIVVGIDGSEASKAALRWAVEEARLRHARVQAVHAWWIVPMLKPGGQLAPDASDWGAEDATERVRTFVTETVGEQTEVEITPVAVQGEQASVALVDAAKGADLLVVGSRGAGGFSGLLLGSISQQCAHHAPCPIVIVREN